MKVWKLTPVSEELNSNVWQGSSHKGWVRIRADSESKAREIAWRMFENKNVGTAIHSTDWSTTPWNNPKLVTCELEDDDIASTEGILDIQ